MSAAVTGTSAGFARTFVVGWGHTDLNGHMRNSAYLDFAVDTRMMYFGSHGFPVSEFIRLQVGPVVLHDGIEYFKELQMLQEVTVTHAVAAMTPDLRRFRVRNEFLRDGHLVARVSSHLGVLDLTARKLVQPPEPLARVLEGMPRTADFSPTP